MAATYLKPGQPFFYSTKFGFTGSAQGSVNPRNHPADAGDDEFGDGTLVAKMARGGHVKAPMRGTTRVDASTQQEAAAPGYTVPTEKMTEPVSAPPARGHARGGAIRKPSMMPGRAPVAPAPMDAEGGGALGRATLSLPVQDAAKAVKKTFGAGRAVGAAQAMQAQRGAPGATTALGAAPPAPVAPTGVPALAKGGHWIAGATKNRGALHRSLGVPAGDKIPAAKIAKAAHSDDPTLRRRAVLAETLKGFHGKG